MDLLTAYFENADPITINTTSLNGTETITSTEHGLETGDAVTYNAAEKVTVDTTQFSSTITINAENHGFSTQDPIVYKAGGSLPISGLTDGTTYFAIRVDANSFKLATTSVTQALEQLSRLLVELEEVSLILFQVQELD